MPPFYIVALKWLWRKSLNHNQGISERMGKGLYVRSLCWEHDSGF